jgi:hypothetical protein
MAPDRQNGRTETQVAEIIETTPVVSNKAVMPTPPQTDEARAATAAPAMAKRSVPPNKVATPHETSRRETPPQGDDVALLEAMLARTAPRATLAPEALKS